MSTATALIVAAGRGQRFGTERPKQYAPLGGIPVLRHCVLTFLAHPRVDGVRVVIHPDDRNLYDDAVQGLDLAAPVPGGGSRQESVRLGLESLEQTAPDLTLIHDAARPFIDRATIDRVLGALTDRPGAIAALPVVDTLKREEDGRVSRTEDRRGLWRAQTPQGFHFDAILAAHRAASGQTLTDDAAVAERAGLAVALVEGSPANIKVTTQDDLESAERWIRSAQATEMRVGQGFDVHAFGPGDHVMLCGLRIGHDAALVGHSDADVGLHAVTDALLGALGAGDIGSHFPPSDPQWKGANSRIFVSHVCDMIAERGGRITHVDLTLICERPKIGPHREAMRSQLAALLGVSEDRVSVKATTTEKLGFLGRGEGVAAQATATLALPVT